MGVEESLNQKLQKREHAGNLRSLKVNTDLIDFTSNDYLGLARSAQLQQNIHKASEGLKIGSTGSRLLSGNSDLHEQVETYLAGIFNSDSALLFNSGYLANLAVLSAVPQRGDTILYDELSHASIKDGLRLSLAKRFPFKHNDLNDLEKKIRQSSGQIYVVVEGIYSMDGDQCPLPELVQLAKQYGAAIILDEAHSTGVYGTNGSGLANELGLNNGIFCTIYTFGKAMGIHGAAVAGSSKLKEYLINFSRPFIYTTAISAHSLMAIRSSFEYLSENIHLQTHLQQVVDFFLAEYGRVNPCERTDSKHPIQGIIVKGNQKAKSLSKKLIDHGMDVRPILSPTVPEGLERLRVSLHTFNKKSEIQLLIDTLVGSF